MIQTGTIAAVAVAFAKYTRRLRPVDLRAELPGRQRQDRAHHAAAAGHRRDRVSHAGRTRAASAPARWCRTSSRSPRSAALLGLVGFGFLLGRNPAGGGRATSPTSGATPAGTSTRVRLVGVAMVGALFSSDAWNNVTFTAGEVRNPRRNLPLSLALGVVHRLARSTSPRNFVYLNVLPLRRHPARAPRTAWPPRRPPGCSGPWRCR